MKTRGLLMKTIRISGYDPIAQETAKAEAINSLRLLQQQVNNQNVSADEIPRFIAQLRDFLNDLKQIS